MMTTDIPAVTKSVNKGGAIEYHIEADPVWDGFDSFIQYLQKHWQAVVSESVDGVDSRRWVLRANNVPISVYHDSQLGNYFLREDGVAEQALLEEIFDDLLRRLSPPVAPD